MKDMPTKYLQVTISAENEDQGNKILDAILPKKLVIGGPILRGPAKFWWKVKISEMNYCFIFTYTVEKYKEDIISEVKKISVEEVPMITFTPFEGNKELLQWIDKTLA